MLSRMERRSTGTSAKYGRGETIFTQGDASEDVLCIRTGGVKLSVLSKTGYEATVAVLGPGEFFGEGCLTGQRNRTGRATAITPSVIVITGKKTMARLLHSQHSTSDRFISHMLSRQIRMEEDLIDQFFSSSEERLASRLLLMAGYGTLAKPAQAVPAMSLDTLADMTGITKSRVNVFLTKFKKLGFIDYDGEIPLRINRSLVSVVLHS
jgi:CRP/FNR family cyclic AMP-dependent transcriptional regulator